MSAEFLIDGYKLDHRRQYPHGTSFVYSNFTPRKSRIGGVDEIVFFGLQYFIKKYLQEEWGRFFTAPVEEVVQNYQNTVNSYLGPNSVGTKHIRQLHRLGYLPIKICAAPEGSIIPMRVPCLTIENTHKDFFWLTNYLETILSCILWGPCTSATTAFQYRKLLNKYAKETGNEDFVPWQGHDFSFRGMYGLEAALMSGAAHLLSFTGTDTIPAIDWLKKYYGADGLIGGSVSATEHSVSSVGGPEEEPELYRRLVEEVYPEGIVSIVSDTYDLWNVLTNILPALRPSIMKRNGKVVIRPDTGDPVKILCGNPTGGSEAEKKGVVRLLYEGFGGTTNHKGYLELDNHVGAIYGDSITLERCQNIVEGLKRQGFASTNVVFGIGSYTYQYVTRDTFGFAVKATFARVNGQDREIYKDPITDNGAGKKSARGLLKVENENGKLVLREMVEEESLQDSVLQPVFLNGSLVREYSLSDIRNYLWNVHQKV